MFRSLSHRLVGGAALKSRSVTLALGEGTIAKGLGVVQERFPDVEIGSYPYNRNGNFGVRLVLRSTDEASLEQARLAVDALIGDLGGSGDWDPAEQAVSASGSPAERAAE